MKVWGIDFKPIYPVGCAAITCTRDDEGPEVAVAQFRDMWKHLHPDISPEPITAKHLNAVPGWTFVLADGNY